MDPDSSAAPPFPPLGVTFDRRSGTSLQTQLAKALREVIQRGKAGAGSALPASRVLAADLGVARNTVTAAYDQLIGEGYLRAVPREGLFVSAALALAAGPRRPRGAPRPMSEAATPSGAPLALPQPFRPCQPDVRLFPLATWNRLRTQVLRTGGAALLGYQSHHTLGLPELRQALAAYLRDSRGVRCDWRQIAITAGSQMALFLLAEVVLRPGAAVVMEDPGYPGARDAWRHREATIVPAPVDGDGAVVPEGARTAALAYLTPSRQHPTGARLPVARRLEWLDFCRRAGAWLVEDDYDSEFRYGRPPLPSLHGLDPTSRVIYVGSMSKVLFPSLRIGYLVLPPALVDRVEALLAVVDNHGPLVDQATLARFLDTGAFTSHIRRARRHYQERQHTLLDAVSRVGLPLEFPHLDGGMNVLGRLPPDTDDERLSRLLANARFDVPALSRYASRPVPPALVMGYTAFEPARLRTEVTALARAFDAISAGARRRSVHRRSS